GCVVGGPLASRRERLQCCSLAAAVDEDADQPGGEDRDREERPRPQLAGAAALDVVVLERVDRVAGGEDREPDECAAAVAVGGGGVGGDGERDDQLEALGRVAT